MENKNNWTKNYKITENKYNFDEWSIEERVDFVDIVLHKRAYTLIPRYQPKVVGCVFRMFYNMRKFDDILEELENIKSTKYSEEEKEKRLSKIEMNIFGEIENLFTTQAYLRDQEFWKYSEEDED